MKLTEQQLSELAAELDQVKANVMNQLGDKEARYIRRMLLTQRLSAISGRILMVLVLLRHGCGYSVLPCWHWPKFSTIWK